MVDRVVLDIELLDTEFGAEAFGAQQRGEPRTRSDLRLALDRQQFAIAPQIVRSAFDRRARDRGADFRVVVADFERTEAGFANVERADWVFLAALATPETGDVTHRILVNWPATQQVRPQRSIQQRRIGIRCAPQWESGEFARC